MSTAGNVRRQRSVCVGLLLGIGMFAGGFGAVRADESDRGNSGNVGQVVPNFLLKDAQGHETALLDFRDKQWTIVAFIGTECPIGNQYVPVLNELQQKYAGTAHVIGINANRGDSSERIAAHAREYGIQFPVLVDRKQYVADLFSAERTPEVFLLDARQKIRYRGRIDDRIGFDYIREKPRRHDLEEALAELLAGKPVSVPKTEVAGCLITRPAQAESAHDVTYADHIAELIQRRCQICHRPGTSAPFSLLTYEEAVNWSAMMKEVVTQRRMPPWHADPRHGEFKNEARLSREEIALLSRWVDQGTPRGDAEREPDVPEYESDGWQIGRPDVIFRMPTEFKVPATGTVRYQYFRTKTNFERDMWLQAAEIRPGNRQAVHHIVVFYRDPKETERQSMEGTWVTGVAPGTPPMILRPGYGRRIPAGAELIWQVHYTPTGKEETDRSEIGFVFCQEPPQHDVHTKGIVNPRFEIPPGDSHFEVRAERTLDSDVLLLSMMPHMHLRGKDFEYRAVSPDGREEVLLSVPRWDFNWQHGYELKEPLRLPKGTTIRCVAHFDNSAANPANPDPDVSVRWGDQTWEEMMIGYVNFVVLNSE